MGNWFSIIAAVLKYAPSLFKFLPTLLKHLPEVIAIFDNAKDLAAKVQQETGINITDALKGILGDVAGSIQKPEQWSSNDRKSWEDRGMQSGQ